MIRFDWHSPIDRFEKVLLTILAIYVVLLISIVQIIPSDSISWPTTTTIDQTTNLPITAYVFGQDIPDGHYSVAKVWPGGTAVLILHKPGPDRDFAVHVMNMNITNAPHDIGAGDRFTMYNQQVVG